jgi:hypothetical protein
LFFKAFQNGRPNWKQGEPSIRGSIFALEAIVRPNEVALFAHASPALTSRLLTVTRPSAPSPSLTSNSFSVGGSCLCTKGRFAPQAASRKWLLQRSDGANATSDLQRPARSGRSRRRAMRRAGNVGLSARPVMARWLKSRRGRRCKNEPCARQLRHCGSHRIRQWLPCRRTFGRFRRHQGDGVPTR